MSENLSKVTRQAGSLPFHQQEGEQEGGRKLAPPVFQLQAGPEAPPSSPPVSPNHTGLPDQLKGGIESLSGFDMSDVRVHYNSDKPAQMQAHAYAQGSEIHVAPGQEQHLAHEAWHVAQQKQGRVQATTQLKGIDVNDDSALEREADVMGAKALQHKEVGSDRPLQRRSLQSGSVQRILVQIVPEIKKPAKEKKEKDSIEEKKMDLEKKEVKEQDTSMKEKDEIQEDFFVDNMKDDFLSEDDFGFDQKRQEKNKSNSDLNMGEDFNLDDDFLSKDFEYFNPKSNFMEDEDDLFRNKSFQNNSFQSNSFQSNSFQSNFFQNNSIQDNSFQNSFPFDSFPFNGFQQNPFLPSLNQNQPEKKQNDIFIFKGSSISNLEDFQFDSLLEGTFWGEVRSLERMLEMDRLEKSLKSEAPTLRIGQVHIIGRPGKLFKESMGDHTTAFGIHSAGIKVALKGKTAFEAAQHLETLLNGTRNLPGYTQCTKMGLEKKKLENAEKAFTSSLSTLKSKSQEEGLDKQAEAFFQLQTCIAQYLEFREQVPLSAINVAAKSKPLAGKGKGEFVHITDLAKWESGEAKAPSNPELLKAIKGTFDPFSTAMAIIESQGLLLLQMVPGLGLGKKLNELLEMFAKNHLQSVALSFPVLGQRILKDLDELTTILSREICTNVLDRLETEIGFAEYEKECREEEKSRLESDYELDKDSLDEAMPDYSHGFRIDESNFIDDEEGDDYGYVSHTNKRKRKSSHQNSVNKIKSITKGEYYKREFKNLDDRILKESGIIKSKSSMALDCKVWLNDDTDLQSKKEEQPKVNDVQETEKLNKREEENLEKEERSQSHGTSITYNYFSDTIMEIKFAGRPVSPLSGTMGAHTTAWVVYGDWICTHLIGKSVDEAIDCIGKKLYPFMQQKNIKMLQLLNLEEEVIDDDQDHNLTKIVPARKAFMEYGELISQQSTPMKKLMLQQYINLLLTFINLIPGNTTGRVDTTGHGEIKFRNNLRKQSQSGHNLKSSDINGLLDIKDMPKEYNGQPTNYLRKWHTDFVKEAYPKRNFSFGKK